MSVVTQPPTTAPTIVATRPDRGERDPAMVGVVAHVDQERPGQRLRELVRELVEEDEREDLERAVPRQEAEERLPDGVAQARGRERRCSSGSGAFQVMRSIGR